VKIYCPALRLTRTDNFNCPIVVAAASSAGHSGAQPELRLLPLTLELFRPDLLTGISGHIPQNRDRFATPKLCTDDLSCGEHEVPIRNQNPVSSRVHFHSS
jgi:hypothetical protein